MLVVYGERGWERQVPGTPILHRLRTPRVVFASGSPTDLDGLGVTLSLLTAVNSTTKIELVSIVILFIN